MSKYLAIKNNDIDNGPGIRVSVWFSGCPHKCKGCHNQDSWNKEAGKDFTGNTIKEVMLLLDDDLDQGLSILGGEPLATYNISATLSLIKAAREIRPDINIWLWTGYELKEAVDMYNAIGIDIVNDLDVDVLVDGRYIEYLHVDDKYKGSSNQRILCHKESVKCGKEIYYND